MFAESRLMLIHTLIIINKAKRDLYLCVIAMRIITTTGFTYLIWKLILVLSSGAMNDFAKPPAHAPETKLMMTWFLCNVPSLKKKTTLNSL